MIFLIVFDLEAVLTESKTAIDEEMKILLEQLLEKNQIAILSGVSFEKIRQNVLFKTEKFKSMLILPLSGSEMWVFKNNWKRIYHNNLKEEEVSKVMNAIKNVISEEKILEFVINNKKSQISISLVKRGTPLEVKKSFDINFSKRKKIVKKIRKLLPNFDIWIAGETSIDITRKGVNKQYGIKKLMSYTGLKTKEIIFVGDSFFEEGNDYPVKKTGIECIEVKNIEETKKLIKSWLQE